jgi:hypothetical protein
MAVKLAPRGLLAVRTPIIRACGPREPVQARILTDRSRMAAQRWSVGLIGYLADTAHRWRPGPLGPGSGRCSDTLDPDRKGGNVVAVALGRTLMKKLLIVAVASAAGLALWRKVGSGKAPEQPWATATDQV